MKTKIYYLTTDEVNARRAEDLAFAQGIELAPAEPRDLPRLAHEGAQVVLDWDYLPPEACTHLLNGSAVQLVGVHGYQLSDSVASFLPLRGIVVSRLLDHTFVTALARRERAA